ncbi:hypothetical protein RHSIM_Rhsim13G0176600 [Rhododendron simsii]|uniref:Uncharacterized protein n=1 Tax=Rhododendron simsii TaxID=118357 RepID=A0A834FY07_RHOSS|nr:hypothetical protein RHSIM_Rhsim13G0176600 [Rhododendron simsii]
MARTVKSWLQLSLKLVNSTIGVTGIAMILYSIWMVRAWQLDMDGSSSDHPKFSLPWFIHAFLGIGIALCAITCLGHIAAHTANRRCLSCVFCILFKESEPCNKPLCIKWIRCPSPQWTRIHGRITSIIHTYVLLFLELIVICTTNSFQHQDFPEDPSGRFDDFDHFVESNFDACKWIGWLLVLAQGCSVLLAAVLRATEKDQGGKYDNEDDYAPQGLPFLGYPYPVQPFPCAVVDFPLALQQ